MNESYVVEELPSRWRRRTLIVVLAGVVLVAGAVGLISYLGSRHLRSAFEEADRLDPGWRFDDIQGRREAIADAENSANTVQAAVAKMPAMWPAWEVSLPQTNEQLPEPKEEDLPPAEPLPAPAAQDVPVVAVETPPSPEDEGSKFLESLNGLPLPVRLSAAQAERVRHEIVRAAGALELARTLAGQPRGRHPIVWSNDYISTLLPTVQGTREAARVLSYDALLRAHDGDLEGALDSCRAILNAGRSLGDEPTLICQLVRIAVRAIARGRIERVLAQGEPSAESLAELQARLEAEAEEPLFLIAVRGERAGMDLFMQGLQRGDIKVSQLRQVAGIMGGPGQGNVFNEQVKMYLPGAVAVARSSLIKRMNEVVEIAKLPAERQAGPLKEWEARLEKETLLVRMLCPGVGKVAGASWRTQAELRCAAVALAAERYRLRHGSWPGRLDDLVPEFLKAVPADPFDGKPLRYRAERGEGVVVYSVGADRQDDGGAFNTLNTHKDRTDLGFRLWEPSRRGRRP